MKAYTGNVSAYLDKSNKSISLSLSILVFNKLIICDNPKSFKEESNKHKNKALIVFTSLRAFNLLSWENKAISYFL